MACKACEERRKMVAEAFKRGGVAGVAKAAPKVGTHLIRNRLGKIRPKSAK